MFQLVVKVYVEIDASAKIVAEYNPNNGKFKCALILNNMRVRCLEFGVTVVHRNPDGSRLKGLHKHKWTDEYADKLAYVPEDIDTSSPEKAFTDFLKECNIEFNGRVGKIPIRSKQLRLRV